MSDGKVLGSIRAFDAEGDELVLASEPQRRLLAMLCLHSGSVLRSVVLEEHLGVSAGALRTSISRLRRVLGADRLVTGAAGYELCMAVDADEYEELVNAASRDRVDDARGALEQARDLWGGSPYDEFAHEPWAEVEVRRLSELHAAAMEELIVILLDAGEEAAAMVELVPLMSEHPYRDRPRALLMRALVQGGRTTEALRQYQGYRSALRDDIGTEPSSALIELDRAIATGVDLAAFRDRGHPAWTRHQHPPRVADRVSHRDLPAPLSSFVGRGREIEEIASLLADHRIVTLTGAGGSGKSRLALRVASTVPDRETTDAWWIDLGVLAADGDVAEQIASGIGVFPRPDTLDELERRLRGRPTLLVLDNAEHVVDATAQVLTTLLTRCPDTRALVTSQQPLAIAGEVAWRVPALDMPEEAARVTLGNLARYDAPRLFLERAREARPGLAIDQRAVDHITSICRELDGMPLALELAAARLRTLSLEAVAQSVNEITRWSDGRSAPLSRHATLRASIEWSFRLISPIEQQMFVALAVFRSPFDIDAAQAVASAIDGNDEIVDLIRRMTDVGLLDLDDLGGGYRMLQSVRQVCFERESCGSDRRRWVEEAHARFFARWCAEVGAGAHGIEHQRFVRRMPDVIAAMAWARTNDVRLACEMCSDLAPVRSALGHSTDFDVNWSWLLSFDDQHRDAAWTDAMAGLLTTGAARCVDIAPVMTQVAAKLPAGSSRARTWLERSSAIGPATRGRPAQLQSYADGLLHRGEDVEASIYVGLAAYIPALMGRLAECDSRLAQLRRLTRRHDTAFSVDTVGNGYAAAIVAEVVRGDLGSACDRARRPVPVDPAFSITSAAALAHAALLSSDAETMARAQDWATRGTVPLLQFLAPFTSCCRARLDGALDEAADHAEHLWDQATVVPVWRLFALPLIAATLIGAGRVDAAAVMTARASVLLGDMEPAPLLALSLQLAQGNIALTRGDVDSAASSALASIEIAREHGFVLAAVDAVELRAAACAVSGEAVLSRTLAEGARAERDRLGYRFVVTRTPASPAPS